jgi:hypothetical protein
MNMWPGLWPGLAWPQAITASCRFRGLGFLTRGLALAWPQAADSGRRRPWLGHGLGQPIDTGYSGFIRKGSHVRIITLRDTTRMQSTSNRCI